MSMQKSFRENNFKATTQKSNLLDLREIASINEEIKSVVAVSGKVYLTALNAMFLARGNSSRSQGFSTVTGELRSFSRKLEAHMHQLNQIVIEFVLRFAEAEKLKKRNLLIQLAIKNIQQIITQDVGAKFRAKLAYHQEKLRKQSGLFCTAIERALYYCKLGQNLAVLAKVESVHADGDVDTLMGIAQRVESIMDTIETSLVRLRIISVSLGAK